VHGSELLGLVWREIRRERALLRASPAKEFASGTRGGRIALPLAARHGSSI
jgi:hypothetical protein